MGPVRAWRGIVFMPFTKTRTEHYGSARVAG